MVASKFKIVLTGLVAGLSLVLFQNCSKVNFTDTEKLSTQSPENESAELNCSLNETLSKLPTKVILVVDQSSSNNLEGTGVLQESTDPGRGFRSQALYSLVSKNIASSELQFSIFGFWSWGNKSSTNTITPEWTNGFSSKSEEILNSVNEFSAHTVPCQMLTEATPNLALARNLSDCGGTPYAQAMEKALGQIDSADDFRYVVIFISDGMPSGGATFSSLEAQAQTFNTVDLMMKKKPGKVFVNTIYYYRNSADPSAIEFIKEIATRGKGTSVSVDSSGTIDLGEKLRIISEKCD